MTERSDFDEAHAWHGQVKEFEKEVSRVGVEQPDQLPYTSLELREYRQARIAQFDARLYALETNIPQSVVNDKDGYFRSRGYKRLDKIRWEIASCQFFYGRQRRIIVAIGLGLSLLTRNLMSTGSVRKPRNYRPRDQQK